MKTKKIFLSLPPVTIFAGHYFHQSLVSVSYSENPKAAVWKKMKVRIRTLVPLIESESDAWNVELVHTNDGLVTTYRGVLNLHDARGYVVTQTGIDIKNVKKR